MEGKITYSLGGYVDTVKKPLILGLGRIMNVSEYWLVTKFGYCMFEFS